MDNQTSYLLSFLALLVYRDGGQMTIEHLSEIAGKNLLLGYDLDVKNDKVTIRTREAPKRHDEKVQ